VVLWKENKGKWPKVGEGERRGNGEKVALGFTNKKFWKGGLHCYVWMALSLILFSQVPSLAAEILILWTMWCYQ